MAAVAFAGSAGGAIRAKTGTLSQRQRADGDRPEVADDSCEPTPDILGGFSLTHVYVFVYMYTNELASDLFEKGSNHAYSGLDPRVSAPVRFRTGRPHRPELSGAAQGTRSRIATARQPASKGVPGSGCRRDGDREEMGEGQQCRGDRRVRRRKN